MSFTIAEKSAAENQPSTDTEPTLHIFLLGEFALRLNEHSLSLETRTHQALLAYLVIQSQHVHSRQQLAFQFWPDSNESQARTNLRKAVYNLRNILPNADCLIAVERQTVQWRPDAPCLVDVWRFQTAVAQSQKSNSPSEQQTYLEHAITAYHGDFLPGFYDDWILANREKLRQQYLDALEKLLLLHENQRHYSAAITLARKLLHEEPLHEVTYRRLMRLQSLDGNVAGALRTYHACSARLQRELGVDPSPATQEAYERLLHVPAPPTPQLAPSRLPLVARDQSWKKLQTAWKQSASGKPVVVLLAGEAGIGKTRLAEEMLDWTERQGIIALTAVCYPSEKQLAYAPVAKWLRSESMQPLFRRLDKRYLVECSRLLPEINSQYPELPQPSPLTESWQRQHMFSALAQTFLHLRQPFLLFIDDLPWCDQDTLDFLLFFLHYDQQARFLLLTTARSEEITPDHDLIPWQQQLDRDNRLVKIMLQRLDVENAAQLAEHVLKQALDSGQASRLYVETEGNPLFVVEMARASLSAQLPVSHLAQLPQKVQAVIENRLATLSHPASELAQLASVIGHSFTFNLLNHACNDDEDLVIRSLDELWQRRILLERGVDAYDFSHDKLRQVAYESLSQTRRRYFHERVSQALEAIHAENLDPISGQIAAHFEAAGNYQSAIAYYHQAARVAQAVFANRDTLQYLQRAINLFSQTGVNPPPQVKIYEQMGDVLTLIGQIKEAEISYKQAASQIKDTIELSRIQRKIAGLQQLQNQYDKAFHTLNKTELLFEDLSLSTEPVRSQEWLQLQLERLWLHYWVNDDEAMAQLAQKLKPIIKLHGTKIQQGIFFQRLVLLSLRRDRYVVPYETVQNAQVSLDAIKESDELSKIALAHFILGFAYLWHGFQGELEPAEHHLQAALKQAEQVGDVVLQCRCLGYLPLIYRKMGCIDKVSDLLPRALEMAEQCEMPEYILIARGNLAWVAWRDGNLAKAQEQGHAALAAIQQIQFPMPMKWIGLWPLLGVCLANDEIAPAVTYAQTMLGPNELRLPDEITAVLQQTITTWENNQPDSARSNLKQALRLAQIYHYL